jgi:hypothetical protein
VSSLVRTSLWHKLDEPGAEIMELHRHDRGWELRGVAVLALAGRPAHVRYRVECDPDWHTRAVEVVETWGHQDRQLRLIVNGDSRWQADAPGGEIESVRGSVDVDLGMTPATNTLPIRRLGLGVGEASELTAAWIRFPDLEVEPLPQRYTRLGEKEYRYESRDGGFSAELLVDDLGLVAVYSGFWELVGSFDA